jgi:L-aspartate oxidase
VALLRDDDGITGVSVLSPQGPGIIHAPAVILASGGLGQLYTATTNPEGATGDGIALALWAGLPVADLEFIQFHPTRLYSATGGRRRPLITEALRGEGAVLVDAHGESVMAGLHPMGDLAPRDVVAAAIDARLRDTGAECVYLDARHVDRIAARFPTVTAACLGVGIDPTRRPIPVVPGAHYSCGGVVTDVHGRTELAGLYAAGEVARTGMHGANRLASNSLLEGLVVGGRAGVAAADYAAGSPVRTAQIGDGTPVPAMDRTALQQAMARWASVVRDAEGLRALGDAVQATASAVPRTRRQFEDGALTTTAAALAAAAAARTESRGAHHRGDHPGTDDALAQSAPVRLVDGRAVVETAVVCS